MKKFIKACKKGDLETIKNLTAESDIDYVEPLMVACWHGQIEIVAYLLTLSEYAKDVMGFAVSGGHTKLVEHLVERGHEIDKELTIRVCFQDDNLELFQYLESIMPMKATDLISSIMILDSSKKLHSYVYSKYALETIEGISYVLENYGRLDDVTKNIIDIKKEKLILGNASPVPAVLKETNKI